MGGVPSVNLADYVLRPDANLNRFAADLAGVMQTMYGRDSYQKLRRTSASPNNDPATVTAGEPGFAERLAAMTLLRLSGGSGNLDAELITCAFAESNTVPSIFVNLKTGDIRTSSERIINISPELYEQIEQHLTRKPSPEK